MVQCSCGKVLDRVPVWLSGVTVEFVCNNCPNRQVKPIGQMAIAPTVTAGADPSEDVDLSDEIDDDEADL
jgi:hypothetical protein